MFVSFYSIVKDLLKNFKFAYFVAEDSKCILWLKKVILRNYGICLKLELKN